MIGITCSICNKDFKIKPSRLKDGYKKYCSRECAHASTRLGKKVSCFMCKETIYKSQKALKKSKSKKFFCNKSCQTKWRNDLYKGEKHSNWKGGIYAYRRMMLESDSPQQCKLCKSTDVRILAVHHIDEDRKNNSLENFAWLCHNCHHLVHHYPDVRKQFMAAMV
jgi:hypothetical protein